MDIWTEEDERALVALETRRKNTFTAYRDNLEALIQKRVTMSQEGSLGVRNMVRYTDMAMALIAHGGEFRDALEPFDHMGRPAAAPAVES